VRQPFVVAVLHCCAESMDYVLCLSSTHAHKLTCLPWLAVSGYGITERRDLNSDTKVCSFQLRIVSELPWHVIMIVIINSLILIVTNFKNHARLPDPFPLTVPQVSSCFCAYARISFQRRSKFIMFVYDFHFFPKNFLLCISIDRGCASPNPSHVRRTWPTRGCWAP